MAQPSFISAALNAQLEKRKDDAKAKLSSEMCKLVDDLFGIFTDEFNRQVQEAISTVNEVALASSESMAEAGPKQTPSGTLNECKSDGKRTTSPVEHLAAGTSTDTANDVKQEVLDSDEDDSILFIGEQEPQRKKRKKSKRNGQPLPAFSLLRQPKETPNLSIAQMNVKSPEEDEEACLELSHLDDDCNCPDCVGFSRPKDEPNDGEFPLTSHHPTSQQSQGLESANTGSNSNEVAPFRSETIGLKCVVTGCLDFFQTRSKMTDHLASAHQLPSRFCYLAGCGMWLPKTIKTAEHLATMHGTLESFPCFGCEHSATSYTSLSKHYNRHHVEGFFQCRATEDCGFSCHFRNELTAHQFTEHYYPMNCKTLKTAREKKYPKG